MSIDKTISYNFFKNIIRLFIAILLPYHILNYIKIL